MQQWDGHGPTLLCPCTWQSFDFPISHSQTLSYEQVTPSPTQAQQAGGQGISQEGPTSLPPHPSQLPNLLCFPKQCTEPAKSHPEPCQGHPLSQFSTCQQLSGVTGTRGQWCFGRAPR